MDKKTWIAIGVIITAFIGLLLFNIFGAKDAVDYSGYDLNSIIAADENSGFFPENVIGDPNAPVIIYEYGDYQCTACAPIAPYINELVSDYDGQVAVVLRTYIMDYHQNGTAAASAANATAKQGYWRPYKDLLFNNQNDWYYSDAKQRQAQFEQYFTEATEGKGDLEKFREDMQSKEVAKKIAFDHELSERADIEWTPTFYLGDERIDQRQMSTSDFLKQLREKIDNRLKELGIEKKSSKSNQNNKTEQKNDKASNSKQSDNSKK